jgi:hypothetical protein
LPNVAGDPMETDDPTAALVRRPWSDWRPFLDKKGLFPAGDLPGLPFPYEPRGSARPALYELARQKTNRDEREVVYLGKTTDRSRGIRTRLIDHYTLDDPLYDRIVESLLDRYLFLARYILFRPDEVSEVDRLEHELRERLPPSRYPWNLR